MKHNIKVTALLIIMFLVSQMIGLFVINQYSPEIKEQNSVNGTIKNFTSYNLPYGYDPPESNSPSENWKIIAVAIGIAVIIMFLLMKIGAERFIRAWFFLVVIIAMGIAFNSLSPKMSLMPWIALTIALPLAIFKVYKRNIIVHNLTELIIYPGIAAIIVPLLNIKGIIILLIIISIYDMYAVWRSGFMQKMAKYQMEKLRIFSGFFVPYINKEQRKLIEKMKKRGKKDSRIKVNVAILGGGDVVFPIILAGIILQSWGLIPALIISLGATAALALLFYFSEKGKFYPAMPFISAGCFLGLVIAYFVK
ncbi:MAG: presenilin family intramembrane aspartyl protease [Nanoarchaeota archaeon]|nr:presenilin family intramembrane aspartyl protease [Nanoarchaeota archaeon]